MLKVYDAMGNLVAWRDAGSALAPIASFDAQPDPYDPGKGALSLSAGGFGYAYDGKDSQGSVLRNGAYLLVLENASGALMAQRWITVLGQGSQGVQLLAGPNPVTASSGRIRLNWAPAGPLEIRVYTLSGELVANALVNGPPWDWDLRSPGGAAVAGGIYVVVGRVPGERSGSLLKLVVLR